MAILLTCTPFMWQWQNGDIEIDSKTCFVIYL